MGAMRTIFRQDGYRFGTKNATKYSRPGQPFDSTEGGWRPRPREHGHESDPMGYLIVFLGGGLGAMLRHGVNLLGARLFPGLGFPIATLTVNVTGSIVMGVLAAIFAFKGGGPQHWRLFLTTGILGGYTTFSSFSLDVALLYERGDPISAALYILASVVISIAGLFLGLWLTRSVL
jgi:CrcB protein